MSKSIEERYHQSFGDKDYDDALTTLWEEHNHHRNMGIGSSWPPSLEQVKKEIESIKQNRAFEHR